MSKIIKYFHIFIFFYLIINPLFAQTNSEVDCYSIVAGRYATTDSSVMLAHNEDDFGEYVFSFYKVPAYDHDTGQIIETDTEVKLRQKEKTYAYLWIDMPMLQFSDSYMNEWGVTIASDQCLSREDNPELSEGGVGYYLRRIMAERAMTAKEAVKIGGQLVEEYGYNASGRTYCIADPDETWMMAVVKGKHWVARRIPPDHVAVISNCYTIGEINLSDTLNYLGSADIIDYAVQRGWYDHKSGEKFSFKYAYSKENSIDSDGNKPRQLAAINFLSEKQYKLTDDLPFSFKPLGKVSKEKLMMILANHFENTDLREKDDSLNDPHDYKLSTICSSGNQYGFVAQLRKNMPVEIGCVFWLAMKRPCIQPYLPVYFGVTKFSASFTHSGHLAALKDHFSDIDRKEYMKESAFWQYIGLTQASDSNYSQLAGFLQYYKEKTQKRILKAQPLFEGNYLALYKVNKASAQNYLNNYVGELMMENLRYTTGTLDILK